MNYIKISRNITRWGWYDDSAMLAIWIHLLIDANCKEKLWHGEVIPRGSLITTISKLASDTGLAEKQVRDCLNRFVKTGEIKKDGASKWTRITIVNYDLYQGYDDSKDDGHSGTERVTTLSLFGPEEEPQPQIKDISDAVERIYKSYPAKCPVSNRNTGKSSKDKEKIGRLLRGNEYTEESLSFIINKYVADSVSSRSYIKNFATFLNNIPDYSEEVQGGEIEKPQQQASQSKAKTYTIQEIRRFYPKESGETDEQYRERIEFIVMVKRGDGVIIVDNEN